MKAYINISNEILKYEKFKRDLRFAIEYTVFLFSLSFMRIYIYHSKYSILTFKLWLVIFRNEDYWQLENLATPKS